MFRPFPQLVRGFLDRFSRSRDFAISVTVHAILIAALSLVLLPVVSTPPSEISASQLIASEPASPKPPADASGPLSPTPPDVTQFTPTSRGSTSLDAPPIESISPLTPDFTLPSTGLGSTVEVSQPERAITPPRQTDPTGLTPEIRQALQSFVSSSRRTVPGREPIYDFTAYIGQYSGGDWDSTVQMQGDKVRTGSLPNLLYLMSYWSKDRVRTNYQNVRAIRLDSDELLTVKPPFIFLTGTRDFVLTDAEVANLQRYLRMGGCIWGDSSVPGLRSRFDIAFRREMLRVAGNKDAAFEPLPTADSLFTHPYFQDVKGVPKGLNSYRLPVFAVKIYGEVGILYTSNDYGDMWQIGLNNQGAIDLRRDAQGRFLAINPRLFDQRGVYVRNLEPASLQESFKFGMNVVMHLLTRWDDKIASASSL